MSDCTIPFNNSNVISPGMFKLDFPPLSLKLRKNREVHVDYLKQTKEHADTLFEIIEKARALKPLDNELHYACLESVEAKILVYKKNESVYEEDIKLLKREIYLKDIAITELRRNLKLAQKQKDEIQLTVENFENSSKSLSKLLDSQITDKCKAGLSETIIKKPVVKTSETKASEDKPKVVRNNYAPLIIEDWILDSDDEDESMPKIEKNTVKFRRKPNWLFDIDALTKLMNYKPVVAVTADLIFSQSSKSSQDNELQPSSNNEKKVDEDSRQEINVVGANSNNELPFDLDMHQLEDIRTFNFSNDDEDDGAEADMNNLDTTIQVSPTLTTRINKGHPLDQTDSRHISAKMKELLPFPRFIKPIIKYILSHHNNVSKRLQSYQHVIKLDAVLGKLRFTNKGEKDPIYGMAIPKEIMSDEIKASASKSMGTQPIKGRGKGLLSRQDMKTTTKASKNYYIIQQRPKVPGEGSSVIPEVPDGLNDSSGSSSSESEDEDGFLPIDDEAN
nr:hypothetical protein [Tanacetum cinerariifolium]